MEIISFKNVSKTYSDGHESIEALKETSFSINSGELVAVVGPSGSGKSTLLTMMGGLQSPTNGEINFLEKNFSNLSPKEKNSLRYDKIGFILQSSNLIPYLTIEEQLILVDKFAKKKYNRQKAQDLMEQLDILKRKDLYPSDLSGGEQQRAAICRALYTEPKLILADEPTASLDTKKAKTVVQLLKKTTEETDRSTVMVTHDERMLTYCDRIFRIIDGQLTIEK
ncbi:ABC transporter ATP-binding protein [Fundicoccus sp. Sow4_H7]|uniref:ABC transporter ATP-binding protein n=1 Tax=Fundicoccus sp. Sow4_H7 TaxID=3438784 RepID=UPI003F901D92